MFNVSLRRKRLEKKLEMSIKNSSVMMKRVRVLPGATETSSDEETAPAFNVHIKVVSKRSNFNPTHMTSKPSLLLKQSSIKSLFGSNHSRKDMKAFISSPGSPRSVSFRLIDENKERDQYPEMIDIQKNIESRYKDVDLKAIRNQLGLLNIPKQTLKDMNRPLSPKSTRFSPKNEVLMIPSNKDIEKMDIKEKLWWKPEDLHHFQDSAKYELEKYCEQTNCRDFEIARSKLYQPEEE